MTKFFRAVAVIIFFIIALAVFNFVSVHATEYVSGENGTLWLQLLRNYDPVTSTLSCHLTSYYPDKTKFLDSVNMTFLPYSDEVFYYDFTVPPVVGIYMNTAFCYLPVDTCSIFFDNDTLNDSSLVLMYDFDTKSNDTFLYDSSPIGGYGVCYDDNMTCYFGEGRFGNSIMVNGYGFEDPYAMINLSAAKNASFAETENMTIALWFKVAPDLMGIIMASTIGGGGGYEVRITPYDTYGQVAFNLPYSMGAIATANGGYDDNNWHLAVGRRNETGVGIWVDGENIFYDFGYYVAPGIASNEPFYLGYSPYADPLYQFPSQYDEVRIYTKMLSDEEIMSLFENNTKNFLNLEYSSNISIVNKTVMLLAGQTDGYIQSFQVFLNSNYWGVFNSTYKDNEGDITFGVKNVTGDIICTGLGDAVDCAGSTSPIILYAEITVPNETAISPSISSWSLSGVTRTSEEVKGDDMHVSEASSGSGSTAILQEINQTTHANYLFDQAMNITLSVIQSAISNLQNDINSILSLMNQIIGIVTQNSLDINQTEIIAVEINATNRGSIMVDLSSVLGNLTQISLDVNSTKALATQINLTAGTINLYVQGINQTVSVDLAELQAVNATLYNLAVSGSNLTAKQVWDYCLLPTSGCYISGTLG